MQPIKEKYEVTKHKYQDTKSKLEGRFFPWARKFWLEIILVTIVVILLLSFNFDLSHLYPFIMSISMVVIAVYVVMQHKAQQAMASESSRFRAMMLFAEAVRVIEESGDANKGMPRMKEALVVANQACDRKAADFIKGVVDGIEKKSINKANMDSKVGDFYHNFM